MGILHTSSAAFYICTYSEGRTVAIKKVPKQYFFLNHTVRSEVMQIRSVKEKIYRDRAKIQTREL